MAIYSNLPGIFLDALDGNLTVYPDPGKPKFLILGTSHKQPDNQKYPYAVTSITQVKADFGTGGTLYNTLVEASAGGAQNFVLWRTGDSDASDGTETKRHQYEELFKAYALMYDQPLDGVVPGGVYLDEFNVMDMTNSESAALNTSPSTNQTLTATGTQQGVTIANTDDLLGLVYAKEVSGEWKFAWWFPDAPTDLANSTFASDATDSAVFSAARILDPDDIADGTVRTDYHEVNFGYQLAEFCHRGSEVVDMRMGFIGVKAAATWGDAAAQANWVGKSSTVVSGAVTVNGTGLLGNKFLSGRIGVAAGPPSFKSAAVYAGHGGFFATTEDPDSERAYLDGTEKLDSNDSRIDIGKYLNIVGSWINYAGSGAGYECSAAAAYAGFAQGGNLPTASATTNKKMPALVSTVLGTITSLKLDALAGKRIVGLNSKATGVVISDGPTAAVPTSDYARLSTMRQVEACVDGIRRVGEPFLGEGMTGGQIAALNTAITGVLGALVKDGSISDFAHQVVVTPQMKILGQAIVQLKIVPAFELRQITVVVGLSAT
jgi:hypothetical protein